MDKLETITIKGFKSIQSLDGFELRDLNVIVGANGAGKSNFISFFQLLGACVDGTLDQFVTSQGGADDMLFNGPRVTRSMSFDLQFQTWGYRFTLRPTPQNLLVAEGEGTEYEVGRHAGAEAFSNEEKGALVGAEDDSHSPFFSQGTLVQNTIKNWRTYHFQDSGNTAGMRRYQIVEDCHRLREDASNIAPYLLRLRGEFPAAYKQLVETVRCVLPAFDDFLLDVRQFGPQRMVSLSWRQKGSDFPMQPYHLSDGSIRFICLAAALLQPEPPACIILDEPELGLHPESIAILAELVSAAAGRSQLIVATQSPLLLDAFSAEDIVIASQTGGASRFRRLDRESLRVWLDKYSLGDLWVRNVIEGGPRYD